MKLTTQALEPSIVSNVGSTTVENCKASSCQCFGCERAGSLCMHTSAGTDSSTAATLKTELGIACEANASMIKGIRAYLPCKIVTCAEKTLQLPANRAEEKEKKM